MAKQTQVALPLLLLLTLTGCQNEAAKKEAVHGSVYYQNEPLRGGTIVFTPDAERGNDGPLSIGEIQPDGHYSLHTGTEVGAAPGWHRVTIAAGAGPDCQAIPARFSDPRLSSQEREVKAGQENAFDFHLD